MGDKNKSEERKFLKEFTKLHFNHESEEAIEGTKKISNISLIFLDHRLE